MLGFAAFRNGLENAELFCHLVSHFHYWCNVIASIAVVGSWPNSDKVSGLEPELEPFLNQLMSPSYQLKPVDVIEIPDYSRAEYPAGASIVRSPSFNVFRVRPHQITKRASIKYEIPSWGIYIFLSIVLIWSIVFISGDSPPWMQRILLSTSAPKGR